jgi:tryptophan-rich sensory protein
MNRSRLLRFAGFILACEAAGGIGAVATVTSIDTWYRRLDEPAFNPPDRVFGPVWTVLYALMGVAVALVSDSDADQAAVRRAQAAFGAQLALNTGWSLLFFGKRSPIAALVEIAFLWGAIVATMVLFARISVIAALLLVPYVLWTSFAAVLNAFIWRLNR